MSAKINVQCPKCGKHSRVAAEFVGRKGKCSCGNVFVIHSPINLASIKKGTSTHPVVKTCDVNRTLLGKYIAWYRCPHCKFKIGSTESELAGLDSCPECHGVFSFANDVIESLKLRQEQDRVGREEKTILKEARRKAKRQKAELKRREKQQLKQEEERLRQVAVQEYEHVKRQLSEEVGMAAASTLIDPASSRATPNLVSQTGRCWYCQNDKGNLIYQCSYCGMI